MQAEGIPDRYKYDVSLRDIRTKEQIKRAENAFKREQKDYPIQNKQGLYLKPSEIRETKKLKAEKNKQIKNWHEESVKKNKEIAAKWGKLEEETILQRDKEPRLYTKDVDDFKHYWEWVDFGKRMNKKIGQGSYGQELKDRLLMAIRGENYIQPNGYKFRGGNDNILANFIEEHMTTDEVEYFFGGNLNFDFIYGQEDGVVKELKIVRDIINNEEYPHLKELWENTYEDEWLEYMDYITALQDY